jgi:hypothetical protein
VPEQQMSYLVIEGAVQGPRGRLMPGVTCAVHADCNVMV